MRLFGFGVITAVTVLWDVTLFSLAHIHLRLGGRHYLLLQGQRINQANNQQDTCSK
jgi:hypothetical protein